jgi:hypothetical protein
MLKIINMKALEVGGGWLLFNAKWAIFQLYHGDNNLYWYKVFRWDDDNVCFVPDKHSLSRLSGYSSFFQQYNWNIVESGVEHHNPNPFFCWIFNNASLLEHQSTGRQVAPFWHIILTQRQPVFAIIS